MGKVGRMSVSATGGGGSVIAVYAALSLALLAAVPDASGHGSGQDRAPEIDFDDRNVTVIGKMSPSDMTVGDFSNAYVEIRFVDVFEVESREKLDGMSCLDHDLDGTHTCKYDVPIRQTTFRMEVWRSGDLLARELFYAEDGILTVDIRPDGTCGAGQPEPWRCTDYYGTPHPIAGGYYTHGQNNPVIDGPIFTEGGLYNIRVEVVGAESPRSNLKDPLEFDLFVSIAQEFTFHIPA